MTTRTVLGAAYWASALINGDHSGLSFQDNKALNEWANRELEEGEEVVDVGEPFFSWSYWLHADPEIRGGDLVEYTIVNNKA